MLVDSGSVEKASSSAGGHIDSLRESMSAAVSARRPPLKPLFIKDSLLRLILRRDVEI